MALLNFKLHDINPFHCIHKHSIVLVQNLDDWGENKIVFLCLTFVLSQVLMGLLVYLQMLLQMENIGSWSLDGLGKTQNNCQGLKLMFDFTPFVGNFP
jgi:hypothetical protein